MLKLISSGILMLAFITLHAQDNDCKSRVLAKKGVWKKNNITNHAAAADYAIQKKFTDALYAMISRYQPMGLQAEWDGSHMSSQYGRPVASYRNTVRALKYECKGQDFTVSVETNTKLTVSFNNDFGRVLFDTTTDDYGPGFNVLREGFPEEVMPGLWVYRDIRTALGFGNEGVTTYWLHTYPGQLPWKYVSRREFLIKRKTTLSKLLAMEEPRYKDQVKSWDLQKKYMEQEKSKDPAKFERFMKMDYIPGIQRELENFKKSEQSFKTAIARVDQQLKASAAELDKPAIVIRSTSNHLDYDFTDRVVKMSELLVKPNPGYFKKGLRSSVPQLIEVAIQHFPPDAISARFAAEVQQQVDHDQLQSWLGKPAPQGGR